MGGDTKGVGINLAVRRGHFEGRVDGWSNSFAQLCEFGRASLCDVSDVRGTGQPKAEGRYQILLVRTGPSMRYGNMALMEISLGSRAKSPKPAELDGVLPRPITGGAACF